MLLTLIIAIILTLKTVGILSVFTFMQSGKRVLMRTFVDARSLPLKCLRFVSEDLEIQESSRKIVVQTITAATFL